MIGRVWQKRTCWQLKAAETFEPKVSLASANLPRMNDLPSHSGLFKIIKGIHSCVSV